MGFRTSCIEQINTKENQEDIGGYFLDGFHSNGVSASQLNQSAVCEIVSKCVEQLQNEKLKVMFGAFEPLLILKLVQIGIDMFDNTYAYLSVMRKAALTFTFNLQHQPEAISYEIDLTNTKYASCYAL